MSPLARGGFVIRGNPYSAGSGLGNLTGTVTDSGTPVAGGLVQLTDPFSVTTTAVPNGSGVYSFTGLPAGTYTRTMQPKYNKCVADAGSFSVVIAANQTTVGDFLVQPADGAENWQGYSSTANMKANVWNGGGKSALFSEGVGGSVTYNATGWEDGSACMQYNWPDRSGGGFCTDYYVQMEARFAPFPRTPVNGWIRLLTFEEAAFSHGTPDCPASEAYKYLLNVWDQGGLFGRLGSYLIGNTPPTTAMNQDIAGIGSGTTTKFGSSFAGTSSWGGSPLAICIRYTNVGTVNASFDYYINNVLKDTIASPFMSTVSIVGCSINCELGSNINTGPDKAQIRRIREFGHYPDRPNMLPIPL